MLRGFAPRTAGFRTSAVRRRDDCQADAWQMFGRRPASAHLGGGEDGDVFEDVFEDEGAGRRRTMRHAWVAGWRPHAPRCLVGTSALDPGRAGLPFGRSL